MDEAIIKIDFKNTYPHKTWISNWSKDDSYPKGFRYKLFSTNNKSQNCFNLVIVLEEKDGSKTEMKRLEVEPSAFDKIAVIFVDGLAESFNLDFQEQDMSSASNAEEFEKLASQFNWYEWEDTN